MTGKLRFRKSRWPFSKVLILQVEYETSTLDCYDDCSPGRPYKTWRDATVEDMGTLHHLLGERLENKSQLTYDVNLV